MTAARKARRNGKSTNTSGLVLTGLQQQIAESAYYKAAERGFEPGGEMDDWLSAEVEIKFSEDEY